MNNVSHVRPKAIVYVEDETTRVYLGAVTRNDLKLVEFLVSGGRKSVIGRLEDDGRSGRENTYGVVDRDFDLNAKAGWCDDGVKKYFRLPAHEIENYLLDFEAIARFTPKGDPLNCTPGHWRDIAHEVAEKHLYSVAYNQAIADIQREFGCGFPKQIKISAAPGPGMSARIPDDTLHSADDVVNRLLSEKWIDTIGERIETLVSRKELESRVGIIVAHYRKLLSGDDQAWTRNFPGKEMLGAIVAAMRLDEVQRRDLAKFVGGIHALQRPTDIDLFLKGIGYLDSTAVPGPGGSDATRRG